MVTAYDYPSARAAETAAVDIVLVGDSGAMTVLGYSSTVPVGIQEMLMLTAATRRGTTSALLVAEPAVRVLRGERRAGRCHGGAVRQGGRSGRPSSSRAVVRCRCNAPRRSSPQECQ